MLCHSQKPYHSISIRHKMTPNIWGGKRSREFCSIEPRAAVFVLSSYCVWRPRGTKKICPLHRYKQGSFFIAFCSSNNNTLSGRGGVRSGAEFLHCIVHMYNLFESLANFRPYNYLSYRSKNTKPALSYRHNCLPNRT